MRAAAAGAVLAALVAGPAGAALVLAPVTNGVRWGETSAALAASLDGRAIRLKPPIEFGDSYVDLGLRDIMIAGYPFTVYFQMDKASHTLKRIMLERPPHGANPKVFHALIDALSGDYGPPEQSCALKASARTGFQAAIERVWHPAGTTVRAVFRDTTLEAAEGCIRAGTGACGLSGRLYVHIVPGVAGCE